MMWYARPQNQFLRNKMALYKIELSNFYEVYKTSPVECSLQLTTNSLNRNQFYPTNSVVEQIFTQDLALYLLLLNR